MARLRRIEKSLTEGGLGGSIWRLALPMMVGGALQNLFSMVDLYFIGRLGHVQVAGLAIAGTVIAVMVMLVQGIAVGTTALVAHFTGGKNYGMADEVLGQTLVLGFLGSIVMLAVSLYAVKPLLMLFGATGDVLRYAAEYLRIIFGLSLTIFLFVGINQALRGAGDARTPLKALVIANIVNIILDPMLIMGYGPFPQLGIAGSAVATVTSRGIGLVFLILHTTVGHSAIQLRLKHFKPDAVLMKRIISIGSFASLQVLIREMSMLMLMRLVSSFGAITLAAFGIGARLRAFIIVPGFGFANAAAVTVGQNMGAGKPKRAAKSGWRTVLYYEVIAIPIAVLFIIFAPRLVGIFSHNAEVTDIGATFLRFLAVTLPFLAFSLILGQGMNGAGDTRTPTIVNATGQLGFRIPLAYLLALTAGMGSTGIWLGINASDITQGIGMALLFQVGYWQKVYAKHKVALRSKSLAVTTDTGPPPAETG
ncbi:hypothetical protein CH330_08985 [candidate division WOR-3 bacterium JGI_Cruoil_03_51_56]|mgnify:CR=1 FL=1|uniref:Multidrug-efflux transporter n=1 Tax=candidate division WOR-3 bacterium JGI_Cruoil_03_51_56 TaxID=1973747 RepID=A0A235BQ20_UNCW3|nr:MAG: hypothetical protein CH330_08985 [candidate division WOR-3 bacterium JGI_Cruoil_03_51_56]